MPEQTIKCPKCGTEIPLTEALTTSIRDTLRSEIETAANKKGSRRILCKGKNVTRRIRRKAKTTFRGK